MDDFGDDSEEKGKKIFLCAYARYLMFGVKWSLGQGLSTHQFSWFY
jgi:hypothetical protein